MLRYELALRAETIAGHWIDHAADRMVDAFVQRAESRLGTPAVTAVSTVGPADPST
jgi:ribosome-associated toxin RatA of RatAB toxin-antitoxin module